MRSFGALFFAVAAVVHSALAQMGTQTGNWGMQPDGTFRNPVVAGDYSDPDIIKDGSNYYLVTSTFWFSPGLVILQSTDMVNWKTLTTVIQNITTTFNNDPSYAWNGMNQYNNGVYAPSIRKNNGIYYIYTNAYRTGFYVSTAANIMGPWTTVPLLDMKNRPLITTGWDDPCPFWTADGKAYLVVSKPLGAWYPHLFQMSPDGKKLLDGDLDTMGQSGVFATDGTIIYNGRTAEGNKYYFWNGYHWFWQTEVTGGNRAGFLMRSKNVYGTLADGKPGGPGNPGTYERKQVINPGTPPAAKDPTQGAILQAPDGSWWFLTQFGVMAPEGRPLNLLPVTWTDGWPIPGTNPIGGIGQFNYMDKGKPPVSGITTRTFPQGGDSFSGTTLDLKWFWNFQPRPGFWSLTERRGFLRLRAFNQLKANNFFKTGNMLMQRYFRSNWVRIQIAIDITGWANGQIGGLAHWAVNKSFAFISVRQTGSTRDIYFLNMDGTTATAAIPAGTTVVYFQSEVTFDNVQKFSYSFDNKTWKYIGNTYTLTYSSYRGSMINLFTYNNVANQGYMDVDYFQYCFSNGPNQSYCP